MSTSNRNTAGSSTGLLELTDPAGVFEFGVEIDAAQIGRDSQGTHEIHATRSYNDVTNISAVWPQNTDLASLLEQLIQMRVVDSATGDEIESQGVEITIILKSGTAGYYRPTDILIDDKPISQYSVSAGFWTINNRLQKLINSQSRGLTHSQIAYEGKD
jgi:hypothetical protein